MGLRPASSLLGSDIIPDYVVNYMRGETPETLARRREREGNPHQPDYQAHTRENSRAADLYNTNSRLNSMDLEGLLGTGASKVSTVRKLISGWRGGVGLNMFLAFLIFVVIVVCLILAVTTDLISAQQTIAVTDKCGKILTLNQGLHGLANVLGVFFVVGANYVAQILVSPTRPELDAAHQNQRWLDIGIPSMRNLGGIAMWRAILSIVIVFIAVGTQVL
jgi:hypothetical protein